MTGVQTWATILCAFPDLQSGLPPASAFEAFTRTGAPSQEDYWNEVSYGRVKYVDAGLYGWFVLPRPQSEYMPGGAQTGIDPKTGMMGDALLRDDCVKAADPTVDFSNVIGMHLIFGGRLDGVPYAAEQWRDLDGVHRLFKETHLVMEGNTPPGPAIVAHEMGHTFRLPHSSGPYGQIYDSRWDVMSAAAGAAWPGAASLGEFAVHTHAYYKLALGWIDWDRVLQPRVGMTYNVTLQQLARPGPQGPILALIPVPGWPGRVYALEARTKVGYDIGIPAEGVLIYIVDETWPEPIHILDQDGNGDPNDAGAIWTPGEVFVEPAGGFTLSVKEKTATGFDIVLSRPGQSVYLAGLARE